jgi:hypothetical protein
MILHCFNLVLLSTVTGTAQMLEPERFYGFENSKPYKFSDKSVGPKRFSPSNRILQDCEAKN